jgi:dipeptidyl aminopeptidase/acylaminoacyl peptidase
MGPVRHPGRYRCAVSRVGVTDIALLFNDWWTDITPAARTYGLRSLVGDPVGDAARLARQSPVHRVADIKVPVLLAQGRLDRRVTPEHADRFEAAARRAGVAIERVDYEDGHGFSKPEFAADFLGRLESFLTRYIGPR